MLGGGPPPQPPPPLDLSALLPYVATALVIVSGFVVLLKSAASKYFAVEAPFGSGAEGYERVQGARPGAMSIGHGEEEGPSGERAPQCFVCGNVGTKVCAGCKAMRYCSLDCQSKHWKEHKTKCRRKVSGSAIALIPGHGSPARGAYKVLRKPKKILFPYDEFVKLFYWDKHTFPPCGLLNCGNSCFVNVVLQCLACTRPLVAYLLEGSHSRECRRDDWCFLCEIQFHIQRVNSSMQSFSPMGILSRLPSISSNLGYGSQEDAHEFMRFAIDTMQSVCLDEYGGEKALDASTQETSLVQHIFGGHLQSQVICTNCNVVSNRYENMMDLTVEIQGDAESLENCLDQFTAKEWLDGENKYKCDGCNGYVKALKRLTVHQAPNILTIALKRFQSGRFGKLNKRVTFPETLDLGPYMSSAGDITNLYSLYAIVVHLDMLNASFFGHYICYTKDFRGQWYRIDDCKVVKVDIEEVLAQGAYMLLYSRLTVRQPKTLEPAKVNAPSAAQVSTLTSDNTGEENIMEISSERTISIGCRADTTFEAKMDMDIDMPQTSGTVQVRSRSVDEDSPVLQADDLKEKKFSQWEISLDGEVGSAEILPPANQSNKLKPLKGGTESGKSAGEEPAVPFEGTATCMDLSPELRVPLSNSFKLEQTRTAIPTDSPGDSPAVPSRKSTLPSPASRGSSALRDERALFSRGFLDKPLKKKPLPLPKGAHIDRLARPTVLNGGINGFCEPRQICNEKGKLASQSCSESSKSSIRNVILNGEAKEHTKNGGIVLSNEVNYRCNGHLETGSSPPTLSKDGGTESLVSCVSFNKPYEQHQRENKLGEMDTLENGCARDTNCDGATNSFPLLHSHDR